MKLTRGIFLAGLLVMSGCAGQAKLVAPENGGAGWTELESEHFVLRTDLAPDEAHAYSTFLEQSYDALVQAAFPSMKDTRPIVVINFANRDELTTFLPASAAGQMMSMPNDLEEERAIVTAGTAYGADNDGKPYARSESRVHFRHELAHFMVHRTTEHVPVWYDEGLAEYYSSAFVEGDQIVVGDAPFTIRVDFDEIPSVHELTHLDEAAFYVGFEMGKINRARARKTELYYIGAWWLVHMLKHGPPEVTSRFAKVLDAIAHDVPFEKAWNEIMLPGFEGTLEQRFRSYLRQPKFALARTRYVDMKTDAMPSERGMSAFEVHLLWARLVGWRTESGGRGLAELQEAADLRSDAPEIAYYRGVEKLEHREYDGAIASFQSAHARAPGEPTFLLGLAEAQLTADAARGDQKLADFFATIASLEPIASTPSELNEVAKAYLVRRNFVKAGALVDRALTIDPMCTSCTLIRARVSDEAGASEDAVRFQKRAIALFPEYARPRKLFDDLTAFEAHAKTKREKAEKTKPSAAPTAPDAAPNQ